MDQIEQALTLLQKEPFQNLATLKHIIHYREHLKLIIEQCGDEWLVIAKIPSNQLAHDLLLYPLSKWTLFVSNSDSKIKLNYKNHLPIDSCVIKTYDNEIEKDIELKFNTTKCRTLQSFSTNKLLLSSDKYAIVSSSELTDEMVHLLSPYSLRELRSYFNSGAKWFGIKRQDKIISGCFIFPNFENIWEIAGVFTLPDYRRNGYAEAIVSKSLEFILSAGLVPRYQVISTNFPSIKLAEKIGMKMLLTVNHFELNS